MPLTLPTQHQRCLAHPSRGSTTQRKLVTPESTFRLHTTHTKHRRHATFALCPTLPTHVFDLSRTARAPTSTHSNGFCVIRVCISSSSSSVSKTPPSPPRGPCSVPPNHDEAPHYLCRRDCDRHAESHRPVRRRVHCGPSGVEMWQTIHDPLAPRAGRSEEELEELACRGPKASS